MTDLIRRKQAGEAWETAVDTGGGGSQTLAQVLVAGGDPDGNPITGAVTISPSDTTAVPAVKVVGPQAGGQELLAVYTFAGGENNGVFVGADGSLIAWPDVTSPAGLQVWDPASGNNLLNAGLVSGELLQLNDAAAAQVLTVGPTGAVTISPSAAVSGLTVKNSSAAKTIESNDTGLGFYGATPAAKPTGVAVSAAGIHAALVTLGLIAA